MNQEKRILISVRSDFFEKDAKYMDVILNHLKSKHYNLVVYMFDNFINESFFKDKYIDKVSF